MGWFNETADLLPPSVHYPHPVYKTPPPFSHKFRDFRVAFLLLAFYFSKPHANVPIARARLYGSVVQFVNQRNNQKRPHPPGLSSE
jgi:hypothetical protein